MTPQLIAIDPSALDTLRNEIERLHARFDAVAMTPLPEWVTVEQMAEMIGRSRRTITRRIEAGMIEARDIGGERMVRANRGVDNKANKGYNNQARRGVSSTGWP